MRLTEYGGLGFGWTLPSFLLTLGVGCIDYEQVRRGGFDVFVQDPADAIDILLVVDNSSSMESYQYALGANFEAFISWFVQGNVDYRIAVTTMDDGNDATVPNAARGAFVGDIIEAGMDVDAAATLFAEEVNVGTGGSGVETGLKTAHLALTDTERLGPQIAAFLRHDASLSIVFVSDEEDSSPWPVNDYVNAFFALKGQRDRETFNASALTVTDPTLCSAEAAEFSSPGTRFVDIAAQTHGVTRNLCDSDFTRIVDDLSLANSRMNDVFALSDEPDDATIAATLEVDGVEVALACDTGEWGYDRVIVDGEERPAIVFDRASIPPPGSRLTVRYLLGDGSVDNFCEGASR